MSTHREEDTAAPVDAGPRLEVESNPHLIIRQHLEELLNASKSVPALCKSSFMCTTLRPVRGIVLLALSAYDVVIIYRASLSLRIALSPQRVILATGTLSTVNPPSQETVQIMDAHAQLTDQAALLFRPDLWNNATVDNQLSSLAPLPAFPSFLNSLQEAFQMDIEAEAWTGLTVAQLAQIVRSPRVPTKSATGAKSARPSSGLSTLESYLSSSLLFHAALAAVTSLDVAILPAHLTDPGSVEQLTAESNATRIADILRAGVFISHWIPSNLTALVSLVPQRTGVDVASWRVTIRLSPLSTQLPPGNSPADRWPPETLNLMEKFFDIRVCAAPFQPSAVTAFFRLLVLPPRALRSIVRLIPFDLHPPAHTPIQLRLGLVRLGTNKRTTRGAYAGTSSPHGQPSVDGASTQSPDFIPGLPGILVRPPRITLQLLVLRAAHPNKQGSLAQLISVGYDWDANRVTMLAVCGSPHATGSRTGSTDSVGSNSTSGPGGGGGGGVGGGGGGGGSTTVSSLSQLLLETEVEANANMLASASGESALVQLASLITQTAAASSGTTSTYSGTGSSSNTGTGAGVTSAGGAGAAAAAAAAGGGGGGGSSGGGPSVVAPGSGPNKPLFTSN
ncbi:unnamed protein product [Echinostoma caproni]|uniref:Mediator of RNA polymerase II transcription subunit 1 n=1 Tax=Echinostoma caproni TaxID=27848 RepID=A0A183AXS0_9TREM|nr:unnamed protein product [Echinostoma caproni]